MKLHLACGKRNFGPDWIHIDGGDHPHLHSQNICELPFEDDSAEVIYASHVLPYFDREEVVTVLREWRRVLRPGGTLRLAVSDFEAMARLYVAGSYPLENFLGPLFGRMPMGDTTIYERTAYDFRSLSALLTRCGFKDVHRYDWRNTEHGDVDDHSQAYLPHLDKDHGTLISLNIEATAAEAEETKPRTLAATAPH